MSLSDGGNKVDFVAIGAVVLLSVVTYAAASPVVRKKDLFALREESNCNFLAGFGGTSNAPAEMHKRQALQSLLIVMLILFFTWFMTILATTYATSVNDPHRMAVAAAYAFLPLEFSFISNPLIYYWRSSLYRNEIRNTLGMSEGSFVAVAPVIFITNT